MSDDRSNHHHPETPPDIHTEFPEGQEEVRHRPWWVGGYQSPLLVALFVVFWVLAAYWLIGWRVRDWQFGTLPYVPAESVYTTRPFPKGKAPKQVELPSDTGGGQSAER